MTVIGFLPRFGEDELLYSLIARYGALVGRTHGTTLMRTFFDRSAVAAAIDLPIGISALAGRLPGTGAQNVGNLIQNHTLYPYLYRFASKVHYENSQRWLTETSIKRPPRIGVMSLAFPTAKHLMFCSACMRSDTDTGMSIWRRIHQVPGVLVCPRHGTSLTASTVQRAGRRGTAAFVALMPGIACVAKPQTFSSQNRSWLLEFARDSLRLLTMPASPYDLTALQERLRYLLRDFRWSRAPSLISSADLSASFHRDDRVGALLAALEVRWTDTEFATALNRLLYRDDKVKHPLMVLMVLRLARATLDDLFESTDNLSVSANEMGRPAAGEHNLPIVGAQIEKPVHHLPCGNPGCFRFRGHVGTLLRTLGIVGPIRHRCDVCGFAYRWNPLQPSTTIILEPSRSWDSLLTGLLQNPSTSVRDVSRRLGVAPTTVMRNAKRLGLWRPEWKDRPKLRFRRADRPVKLLMKHRKAWIAHRDSGTHRPLKALPRNAFNAYRYLTRHDRPWMVEHGMSGRWSKGEPNCKLQTSKPVKIDFAECREQIHEVAIVADSRRF